MVKKYNHNHIVYGFKKDYSITKKTDNPIEICGITCYLPDPPEEDKILNSHLPIEEQKWKRPQLPDIPVSEIEVVSGEQYDAHERIDWEAARREEYILQKGQDPWKLDNKGEPVDVKDIDPNPTFVFDIMEAYREQELARCHPLTGGVWVMI
ncbi:MAG: hypothetical protein R3345_07835, partial [Fulvivirga sp.]|nr:hypothetical protein [Fulvivirga sp.]